jgi:hypothetical protein
MLFLNPNMNLKLGVDAGSREHDPPNSPRWPWGGGIKRGPREKRGPGRSQMHCRGTGGMVIEIGRAVYLENVTEFSASGKA